VICKDNSAINYISVQHKKVSFPSTLTDHTTLVKHKGSEMVYGQTKFNYHPKLLQNLSEFDEIYN
jgi:hypothetical protein